MTDQSTTPKSIDEERLRRIYRWRNRVCTIVFLVLWFAGLFTKSGVLRPFNSDPSWTPIFDSLAKAAGAALLLALAWSARCPACGAWLRLDGRTCGSCKRDLQVSSSEVK